MRIAALAMVVTALAGRPSGCADPHQPSGVAIVGLAPGVQSAVPEPAAPPVRTIESPLAGLGYRTPPHPVQRSVDREGNYDPAPPSRRRVRRSAGRPRCHEFELISSDHRTIIVRVDDNGVRCP